MLTEAKQERMSTSDQSVDEVYKKLLHNKFIELYQLDSTDIAILDGIRRQQHGYVAEMKDLSLCDLADAHDDGVMAGEEKAIASGYITLIKYLMQGKASSIHYGWSLRINSPYLHQSII
jgi:hypothetical protein